MFFDKLLAILFLIYCGFRWVGITRMIFSDVFLERCGWFYRWAKAKVAEHGYMVCFFRTVRFFVRSYLMVFVGVPIMFPYVLRFFSVRYSRRTWPFK